MRLWVGIIVVMIALGLAPVRAGAAGPATKGAGGVVRVAAIGAIQDMGFWEELVGRFEKETGIRVETVATGNKDGVAALFRAGGIDLITVQSADLVMDLVAGGYAMEARPWVEGDLAIVGPAGDPAGVKGMRDAAGAVRKIIESKSELVVHGNSGADQIVRGTLQGNKALMDAGRITVLLDDHQRRVLQVAAGRKAYTLIARVPFVSGKIGGEGLVVMVAGDPVLRRPWVEAVADPARVSGAHVAEARRLAEFLRGEETQRWIGGYGKGKAGGGVVFYPVVVGGRGND